MPTAVAQSLGFGVKLSLTRYVVGLGGEVEA